MSVKNFLATGLWFIMCHGLYAQPFPDAYNRVAEAIISSSEYNDETDYQFVIEELQRMAEHPMNINTAGAEDFNRLPFLTDFEIFSIIDYRDENGPFLSIYELQLVHGLDAATAELMLPYVTVSAEAFSVQPGKRTKGEILMNFQVIPEKSKGYIRNPETGAAPYEGNPWRYYSRISLERGIMSAGMTAEKDPGESFFSGSNKRYPDFISGHVFVKDAGILKSIAAGDFRMQFGQGLTLWNGFSPGKSSLPLSIIKHPGLLKPYTSNDENNFFRGLGACIGTDDLRFTLFFSSFLKDANVTDTLESGLPVFTTFSESGYHRTASELEDRNSIRETAAGFNATYRGSFYRFAATIVKYSFNGFMSDKNVLYEANDFEGRSFVNAGADYSITPGRLQIAGEIAYGNGHIANIHNLVFNTGKYASFALSWRYYAPGYFSLHSSALSEGSDDRNESGLYIGTVLHPARHVTVSAYGDFFRHPWIKYNTSGPSWGTDYLVTVDFNGFKDLGMSGRFRFSSRQEEISGNEIGENNTGSVYRGFRYTISYSALRNTQLSSRIEFVRTGRGTAASNGFMWYQDAGYTFQYAHLGIWFRYAWFSTGGYSARIYAYEQQTLPSFSSAPLYDKGQRSYLMLRYDLSEHFSFWLRFEGTWYADMETTGSGYDLRYSGSRHEIRLQVNAGF